MQQQTYPRPVQCPRCQEGCLLGPAPYSFRGRTLRLLDQATGLPHSEFCAAGVGSRVSGVGNPAGSPRWRRFIGRGHRHEHYHSHAAGADPATETVTSTVEAE